MLNHTKLLQDTDINGDFEAKVTSLLGEIPFLKISKKAKDRKAKDSVGPDLCLSVNVGRTSWTLLFEFKKNTEIRYVRNATYQLRHFADAVSSKHKYAVLVGPHFSPEAAGLIRKESMGFVDLAGNCLLNFDNVYIERSGARNPFISTRKQRSLFTPKSSRILMQLLQEPFRSWGTVDLAKASHVSPGQVSNVKKVLLDREWVEETNEGIRIFNPDRLLDAWRDAYQKGKVKQSRYYSPLHGKALDEAIRTTFKTALSGAKVILSSSSAANWMAPFVRDSTVHFYADKKGEDALKRNLKLESVSRGENVIIESPADEGVFLNRVEAAPGIWTTHPIQTYLDLSGMGERGREAAEHLRTSNINPTLSKKN